MDSIDESTTDTTSKLTFGMNIAVEITPQLYDDDSDPSNNYDYVAYIASTPSIAITSDFTTTTTPIAQSPTSISSGTFGKVFITKVACTPGHYGLNCKPCSCSSDDGYCSYDLMGTGTCTSCKVGHYGKLCDGSCPRECNGTFFETNNVIGGADSTTATGGSRDSSSTIRLYCDEGVYGTGTCFSCPENYYGYKCKYQCSCVYGKCDDGLYGTGYCQACQSNYYGRSCDKKCTCNSGVCRGGVDGDGSCICTTDTYGPTCSKCTCVHGTCDSGVLGRGTCLSCMKGFYGINCDKQCALSSSVISTQSTNSNVNGVNLCISGKCLDGPSGNGTCVCPTTTIFMYEKDEFCVNEVGATSNGESKYLDYSSGPSSPSDTVDNYVIITIGVVGVIFVIATIVISVFTKKHLCDRNGEGEDSDEEDDDDEEPKSVKHEERNKNNSSLPTTLPPPVVVHDVPHSYDVKTSVGNINVVDDVPNPTVPEDKETHIPSSRETAGEEHHQNEELENHRDNFSDGDHGLGVDDGVIDNVVDQETVDHNA
eukprot:TRINITY_DN6540_c0_g1_i5.p1 TRINITY_DN6540_c0_g1~~TRINITY_DN6540_c0_g1_i5.p1  ORF type:complete len:538 (+),score=129.97 TRINITY_DN6540_c0_g1_i5:134-1747(+)